MDSHQLALKNYIDAARANAMSDESIYGALIASGWQHDMVAHAFNSLSPETSVTPLGNITSRQLKIIKIIGIITIVLGALAVVSSLLTDFNGLQILFGIIEALIGIGLILHKRTAYTFFNVVAILAILSGLITLPGVALAFTVLLVFPSFELILLIAIGLILSLGQPVFYIYGGIVFHNKAIRAFFKNNHQL